MKTLIFSTPSMIQVFKNKCDECLFSQKKIVNNQRRIEIIKNCDRQNTFFECHKSTLAGKHIACKGWAEHHAAKVKIPGLTIAQILEIQNGKTILFVER